MGCDLEESVDERRGRDRTDVATVTVGDGRRITYAEYGAPEGTPVVFLHGTPGSRLLGRVLDEDARRYGVRLLSFDRPGYGYSSPWPGRTLTDIGEVITAVLDDAGVSRAGVVGFSGGGPHALAVAATHGDRVRDVDVIAGATPPSLTSETPTTQRLIETLATKAPFLLKWMLRAQVAIVERTSTPLVVSQYTTADGRDEVPSDVVAQVERDFVEAFANTATGFVTESRLLAQDWDVAFDRIDQRVRLWHGGRDTNVPADGARRLCEQIPDGQLTVFDDADHLTTLLRGSTRVFDHHRPADG